MNVKFDFFSSIKRRIDHFPKAHSHFPHKDKTLVSYFSSCGLTFAFKHHVNLLSKY